MCIWCQYFQRVWRLCAILNLCRTVKLVIVLLGFVWIRICVFFWGGGDNYALVASVQRAEQVHSGVLLVRIAQVQGVQFLVAAQRDSTASLVVVLPNETKQICTTLTNTASLTINLRSTASGRPPE